MNPYNKHKRVNSNDQDGVVCFVKLVSEQSDQKRFRRSEVYYDKLMVVVQSSLSFK